MERYCVVIVCWILFSANGVFCKRYELPNHWTYEIPNHWIPGPGGKNYSVVTSGIEEIVSDNGTFALAFWGYTDLDFFPSVWIRSYQWPSEIAIVMRKNQALVPVWKSDFPTIQDIQSDNRVFPWTGFLFNTMELNENGNLALLLNGKLLWQSFDNPLDILLPGQSLQTGGNLTSHSTVPYAPYTYVAEVASSGFLMYIYSDRYTYELWDLQSSRKDSTVEQVRRVSCQGYEAFLEYTGSQLNLFYKSVQGSTRSSSHCDNQPMKSLLPKSSNNSNFILPYLQLDGRGDIVIFSYDNETRSWVPRSKLSTTWEGSERCKFPTSQCGENSLDARNYICNSFDNTCEALKSQSPVQIPGVGHSILRFTVPDLRDTTFEDCNDHFQGRQIHPIYAFVFYDSWTRDCFFLNDSFEGSFTKDSRWLNMTMIAYNNTPWEVFYVAPAAHPALLVGVGLMVGIWLIAGIALLIVKYEVVQKVTQKIKNSTNYVQVQIVNHFNKAVQEVEIMLSTMQGLPRRYTYMELEKATDGFSSKLGSGGFGTVYEGYTSDGRHVAVKKLDGSGNGMRNVKQFVAELVGVGGVSHCNIVKLYGFCIEGTSRRLLVYEYMPNGSLDRWIFGTSTETSKLLDWNQRFDIALGTARGLAYLHGECSEPILHLDVKPQNILLDDKFVPKIADFGMAKLLEDHNQTQVETLVRGTPGYLAPEWLLKSIATKKCDVFSFGMVLLELIGGRRNIDWTKLNKVAASREDQNSVNGEISSEVDDDGSSWYFPSWVVKLMKQGRWLEVIDEQVRSAAAEKNDQTKMTIRLAMWCIQDNPHSRPSMREIVETLEGRREVHEPPIAFHFESRAQEIIRITESSIHNG